MSAPANRVQTLPNVKTHHWGGDNGVASENYS